MNAASLERCKELYDFFNPSKPQKEITINGQKYQITHTTIENGNINSTNRKEQ